MHMQVTSYTSKPRSLASGTTGLSQKSGTHIPGNLTSLLKNINSHFHFHFHFGTSYLHLFNFHLQATGAPRNPTRSKQSPT